MPTCAVCGHETTGPAKFCPECGASLSSEPPREERKVVTVLFADLVGFTSRAERLDPEDVRALLAPYWERLRSELETYGGTVEKFIGDAVMALFGAPVAHEDDPERAVRAALAIRDWAREEDDLQVRIAVNTGEALVLLGSRPAEGEGMATGDVVNTAARLQAAAPVNGVLVGETTYRATRHVVDYAEREAVVAKGKAEPVAVWEAVQVRSRLGMDVEGSSLPLVGRTRELGVIVEAFERARNDREPQLVTLVGVPGIGKSRLVGELFARLETLPDLVWWRQGRALPYGEGVSFWAFAEMVKAQAGIQENDPAGEADAKLRASVESLVAADELDWVLEHLRPLVGGDPRRGSGESFPAWRQYVEGLAEQRPLVMVFEDMHWADDGLLDFVDHLVEWTSSVALLVLATARPELLDRRTAWGGGKLNVSTIALTPLSDEESAEIIHAVLERAVLPAETQRELLDRAGGNPLYAEQFARLYLERGTAEDLPLPETVQGLIAARIDGLTADEKRLIQDAAVLGKVFWAGAAADLSGLDAMVVDQALHALERKGMLRRERRSAVAGETQYAFRHVLVRDVAYGQIPRAARGGRHVRAADWIESLGRADDHAELVAHHLEAALELGAVDEERARLAFRRAGERAQALGAWVPAEHYFSGALALWPQDDPERPGVLAAHARARFKTSAETEPLAEALDALELAGRREEAAELAAFAALASWYQSRADEAGRLIERARALLEGLPPSAATAAVLAESARLAVFAGRHEDAHADGTAALELAERLGLDDLRAGLLTTEGVLRMIAGELDQARSELARAVEVAPPGSVHLFRALANLAVTEIIEGDADAWQARHAAALDAATRAGDRVNVRWLEAQTIADAVDSGRWDEALRRIDAFLAEGPHYQESAMRWWKASILAARGATAEALNLCDRVLAAAAESREEQVMIPMRMGCAWVYLLLGDEERAQGLVEEAMRHILRSRAQAPGIPSHAAVTLRRTGHADAWLAHHADAPATRRIVAARLLLRGELQQAADAWARVSPHDEAVARLEAARQLVADGRRAEADLQLQRGLAFFRAVGASHVVRQAEQLLAAAS